MKPEHEERAKICMGCEYLRPTIRTCKKCGCFMPAKVRLDFASCPIGKWKKIVRNPDGSVINSENTNTPNQEE